MKCIHSEQELTASLFDSLIYKVNIKDHTVLLRMEL